MKGFRRCGRPRVYPPRAEPDKSKAPLRFVFLRDQKTNQEVINATRRQVKLHIEAKTEGRAHRGGLREARRFEEAGQEARLGDREQVGQRRKEERLRSGKEEQQSLFEERREEGREKVRRQKEALSGSRG